MTIDAASGSNPYASLIATSDALVQASAADRSGAADTSAEAARTKAKEDKDTFLKLLVAQLKYQDPSKPADSTQFMAQTAQFSALEKMQEVATSSTSMVTAQNKLQASALVGTTVTYVGPDGQDVTGVVTSASFNVSSVGGTAGEPVLKVGGQNVVLSKVTSVQHEGATTTAAGTTAAGTGTTASGTTAPTTA